MELSIATTIYDSASDLEEFYSRICIAAKKLISDYEIISMYDGSPDNSLDIGASLFEQDSRVRAINPSRHCGHHKAIMFSEKSYCNPGSVGQTRDGDARAAYAVITDDEIHLRCVEYYIDEIALQMKKVVSSHIYIPFWTRARELENCCRTFAKNQVV